MAVTVTAAELVTALRLGDTAAELAEVTRLLAYATEAVTTWAPLAPDLAQTEACIRLAAYQFDRPTAGRGAGWSNALRNSGAGAILASFRQSPVVPAVAAIVVTPATVVPPAPPPPPAGLRQTGSEDITVTTASQWVSTGLPFPETDVFGVKVGMAPINLGLTADLPDASVVDGGSATTAIGVDLYAVAAASVGGTMFFASSKSGVWAVRAFEHG